MFIHPLSILYSHYYPLYINSILQYRRKILKILNQLCLLSLYIDDTLQVFPLRRRFCFYSGLADGNAILLSIIFDGLNDSFLCIE